MPLNRRDFLRGSGLAALGLSLGTGVRWAAAKPAVTAESNPIIHVLNRITWGLRPEDIVKINELGIEGYIDWQLAYDQIDDPLIRDFLDESPVLTMNSAQLSRMVNDNYDFVFRTAMWGRIYRAAYSERQLYELMVEFWTDHFNIPIGDLLISKIVDDTTVIRQHALGNFRELLLASAQSPAMLYYLNNAESSKEYPNENYARELMELHTLGVDGGYTEADVKAFARALTGWQVETFKDGETFVFNPDDHDYEEKHILGHTFPAGRGIEDGLQLLDLLATHPSTAAFISAKLCRRFISDQPVQSIIDSAAGVFTATNGDIKAVMRHILLSSEFMNAQWQKFRRPLDFVVALLRVMGSGLTIKDEAAVIWTLEPMGQLPYFWHPPNGYPDAAGAWMNTNGLLQRWNLAMTLPLATYGYWDGARFNMQKTVPQKDTIADMVDIVTAVTIGVPINDSDRDQLIAFVSDGQGDGELTNDRYQDKVPTLLGLMMSSPYFQWH